VAHPARLHGPGVHPARFVAAVERDEVGATEFMAVTGGRLGPHDLTEEGRAFSDTYYGRYLDDFSAVFAADGPYGVAADADAYDRIAPVIDRRHAEWVYEGRPELPPEEPDAPSDTIARVLDSIELPQGLTREQVANLTSREVVELLTSLAQAPKRPLQASVDDWAPFGADFPSRRGESN